jgi:DNA-binding MarR family transcriptional regulator
VGVQQDKDDLGIDEKVLIALAKVAESWKKNCTAIFKNFGLTYAQYNVLRALNSFEGGINTITNISLIMLVSGANMTGIAKRMEERGFILRKSDPHDERKTMLEITPRGIKTLKNISGDYNRLMDHLLQDIPASQRKDFLETLKNILKVSTTFTPNK